MTLERRKLKRSIPSLQNLDQDLFFDIKRIFVFGREGEAAFFITKKDRVYAYGQNSHGCLGVGDDRPVPENDPQEVVSLSRRKIVEFAAGRDHVLALSSSGQVYACGNNEFGQLGLVNVDVSFTPLPVEALRKEKVIAIACGAFHSIAVTSRGLIYSWGYNFFGQLGIGRNDDFCQPILIQTLRKETIIEVACGQHHSVAMTKKGDLWAWGHNGFGQLGIGERCNYRNIPVKVITGTEHRIKKVTCGQNHVLVVTDDGKMLGFGSNYYGQLGTGSRENQLQPIQICCEQKIRDCSASPFSNTSVARSKDKRNSFVFGKYGNNYLLSPVDNPVAESNKDNTDESFAQICHTTAHTAIVKSNKKNRWWYLYEFFRKKFL